MFADSLCETHWDHQSHLGWATLVSFALQAFAVTTLLALPFLYTQGLQTFVSPPKLLVPIAFRAPAAPRNLIANRNRWVSIVPPHPFVYRRSDVAHIYPPSQPSDLAPPDVNMAGTGSSGYSTIEGLSAMGNAPPIALASPSAPARSLPISHMMEGNLIHRVEPIYPAIARQARIQGMVLLRATISKDGTIENLQLLNGHPMLAQAAIAAVRQWRYRPYYLNGQPVEVETRVSVQFTLSGG